MTRDEIISAAVANGYDTTGKTDAQLLADAAFFKAACTGMADKVMDAASFTSPCPSCGMQVSGYRASTNYAWLVLMVAENSRSSTTLTDEMTF